MIGLIEGIGVKVSADVVTKLLGYTLKRVRNGFDARIEDWVSCGVDAFEEYGCIPQNGADEDLDNELRSLGLEINEFVQSNLVRSLFYQNLMWTVAIEIQIRTANLTGRRAGDFFNYNWHGIGGWIA